MLENYPFDINEPMDLLDQDGILDSSTGLTLLMITTKYGALKVVERLLQIPGIDVNVEVADTGRKAIDYSRDRNDERILRLFENKKKIEPPLLSIPRNREEWTDSETPIVRAEKKKQVVLPLSTIPRKRKRQDGSREHGNGNRNNINR